ncbi:glycosyltransferase [Roseicyclus sp. F158]|uniref:Glycosyltransferase n=1 Tax=Tropicimonas omnivorans TaxID=3075590 RepID=A0ABU3DI85_9RHOB|nr:glycosyltransferase [Roseicyclus sp. F158]MDT0683424.1 glycosyltransferase [Roseicyclus sp. F158]
MTRAVAVIPARDEADRLPTALASLRREGLAALVVANGCTDATAELARAEGAAVIETPALAGGVGAARAIGLDAALDRGARILFTIDADCTLAPGSVAAVLRALDRADAVFGRVVPDATEFAVLPRLVRRHGAAEDRCDCLRALIAALIARRPWDPFPAHGQSPGALIAWHASAYRAVGGIDPVASHEDRRMAAALIDHDLRVARPWDAVVVASCRLRGRAPGGMADTIAERTHAGARLAADAVALERECARLERRLAALAPRADWPSLPSLFTKGDDNVPSFQQASV